MSDSLDQAAGQVAAEPSVGDLAVSLKSDPESRRDPHPIYRALRESDPVYTCPAGGELFVTGYEAVDQLLRDGVWSRDVRAATGAEVLATDDDGLAGLFASVVLFVEGDQHKRVRKAFARSLSPRVMEAVRPICEAFAEELLDELEPRGSLEVRSEFAERLGLQMMCHLLGLPAEDGPRFTRWSHEWLEVLEASMAGQADVEVAQRAFRESQEYLRPLVLERAKNPGDDIMSTIAVAYDNGELTEAEAVANTLFLIVAGYDTTYRTLTNGLYSLLQHPTQYALLRESPELAGGATEEILRYDSAARNALPRWAAADGELGGHPVCPGAKAVGMLNAANRDPAVFEDPDRFDITREVRTNLAFGRGHHVCSGASLARIVIQSAIVALTRRFEHLEITEAAPRGTTWNARETLELHVSWAPAGSPSTPDRVAAGSAG